MDVLRPYLSDTRFSFVRNPSVWGWAGNIDRLISAVETDLFVILPDDDKWDRDYLRILTEALDNNANASVAYSDLRRFWGRPNQEAARAGQHDARVAAVFVLPRLWQSHSVERRHAGKHSYPDSPDCFS